MSNNMNETIDYEKYIRLASEDYREDSMNNRADIMRDAADSYAALTERVKKLEAERDAWREYAEHQETCGVCADYVGDCDFGTKLRRLANPGAELLNGEAAS